MNTLKTIRRNLCISQEQLAKYISKSRSYVAMNEIEERVLPTKSWNKLLKLNSLYHQVTAAHQTGDTSTSDVQLPNNEPSIIMVHLESCKSKKERLEKKLQEMQINYQHYQDVCTVITLLRKDLPEGKEGKKDLRWLEALQADMQVKLFDCSIPLQQILHLQIEALKFEITMGLKIAGVESRETA